MLNFAKTCGSIATCDMSTWKLFHSYRLKISYYNQIREYVTYFLIAFKTCIGSDELGRRNRLKELPNPAHG